jgi:polysaccharide pyruvyl transferase WcaK-like protein
MLEYRPKCLDLMLSMGLEKYTIRTDEIDCERLSALVDELAEEGETIQTTVRSRIAEVGKRYDATREVVSQVLEGEKE